MKKSIIVYIAIVIPLLLSCGNKNKVAYKDAGGLVYARPSVEDWTEINDRKTLPGNSSYKTISNTTVTSYMSEKYNASILIENITTTSENPGEAYGQYFDALFEKMKKLGTVEKNNTDEEKIKSRQMITEMNDGLISLKCMFYDDYETDALIIDMIFTKENIQNLSKVIEDLFNSVQYKRL